MKGLKTSGTYDLMKDGLSVDANSGADVNIPLRNNQGEAILLPRAAAEGVNFLVTTANGGTYTAILDKDLELKAGYKHTFHIRLKSTPVLVSATITPWIEGPERQTDVVRVVTGLNDSRDFQPNDVLNLYLKDKDDTNFNYLTTFTYGTDNKWIANKQVYWESIKADPAVFRGATTIAKALNGTQMADILVSKDVSVSQYTGVNLEMAHVLSKITVNIYPGDGFTLSELQTAANASTPTLYPVIKGFIMDGTVNVTTAKVSALGTTIVSNGFRPSMLGSTPNGAAASYEALIMPQTIIGKNFIDIVLDGHIYNAQADNSSSLFNAGQNHIFNIYLKKTGILLSTSVAP